MDNRIAEFLIDHIMADGHDRDADQMRRFAEERNAWNSERYFFFVFALTKYTFVDPDTVISVLRKYIDVDNITAKK